MKNQLIKIIVIVFISIPLIVHAQFDSVLTVFKAPIWAEGQNILKHITRLGDQNDDGYDDFIMWNCRDLTFDIYFGGEPLDTIPKLKIKHTSLSGYGVPSNVALDINNDGYKDFVCRAIYTKDSYTGDKVNIYYGGPLLDTIPDISFRSPKYKYSPSEIELTFFKVIKDYNGDGRNELVMVEFDKRLPILYPDSNWVLPYRARMLIYNLGSEFDTLDYAVINSPADSIELFELYKTGDVNNDGYADLITRSFYTYEYLHGTWSEEKNYTISRIFYGNNKKDFIADKYYTTKDSTTYFGHIIPFFDYAIINDINGDGKEDILMRDYKHLYPYYYGWGISYGDDSLNFDIDIGINTQNIGVNHLVVENGDFNGDGYGDFITITNNFGYQNVVLYLGAPDMLGYRTKVYWGTDTGIGRMVESVGDVNGDGADDFCIGEVNFGGENKISLSKLYIFAGDTSVVVTNVRDDNSNTFLKTSELIDAYPNPFNPSTTISYSIPSNAKGESLNVKLTVYDALGREVATLVNKLQKAGKYQVEFNAKNLSSGTYYYQLKSGEFSETKKIILIK